MTYTRESALAALRGQSEGVAGAYRSTKLVSLAVVDSPSTIVIVEGRARLVSDTRVVHCGPGQLLVTRPREIIKIIVAEAPCLAHVVPIRPEIVVDLALNLGQQAPTSADAPSDDAPVPVLEALFRFLELYNKPADRQVLADGAERELHWRLLTGAQGGDVLRLGNQDHQASVAVFAAEWLDEHFAEPVRVVDLAHRFGVSAATLNRYFRASIGQSPLQYQKDVRLRVARLRLCGTATPIATIAHDVGYVSASHFSRDYRMRYGLSPSDERRVSAVLPAV